MSDATRQNLADALAAHVADEISPDSLPGAWVPFAQVVSQDGDDGYLYEGDGSIFARAGLAHSYLTSIDRMADMPSPL